MRAMSVAVTGRAAIAVNSHPVCATAIMTAYTTATRRWDRSCWAATNHNTMRGTPMTMYPTTISTLLGLRPSAAAENSAAARMSK
jgi:hypothetical protein